MWQAEVTLLAVHGLLIAVASLVAEHALWDAWVSVAVAPGLMWFPDSRAQAHQLWHMGLVAPQYVESS